MNAHTRGHATVASGHRLGLRAHLIALVLAVLLPALAVGAVTAWHMAQNYRAAFEMRLLDTARALALAVDREITANVEVAAALASSPLLARGRPKPAPDSASRAAG